MNKDDIEGYKKPTLEGKIKGMYRFFYQYKNDLPNYSDTIKSLCISKLLIWGTKDRFLILDKMKDKVIRNLKINSEDNHILEAKHFIQEEKSEDINRLILEFLKNKTR